MIRLLAIILITIAAAARADADAPPNIVFILADDLGWNDLGFMGSDYHRTPHLDRLAADGVTFMQAYANASNCAPSRAALLSGTYPPRTGVYTVSPAARGKKQNRAWIPVRNTPFLDGDVVTLAEVLRAAGYSTATIGKYHVGDLDTPNDPRRQGFDVNRGGWKKGHPKSYRSPYANPALPDGPDGEYLTDRLTDEAIAWIEDRARTDAPFFLYLPYYTVHTPIQPDATRLAALEERPKGALHANPKYAAMVESLDANVGRLLATLDRLQLADDTLVVFTSDNGGHRGVTRMNLRGGKGTFHEGGLRVPLAVRWPGRIAPGRIDATTPVMLFDFYPTLATLGGATLADHPQPIDGVDLTPILTESAPLERDALFWHFPAYLEAYRRDQGAWRAVPCSVIRAGDWKLIETLEDGSIELYNLTADPRETTNRAADEPERVAHLRARLEAWRNETGAALPTKRNPAYRPDF